MAFLAPEYITRQAWHVDTCEGVKFFFASTPFDGLTNIEGVLEGDTETEAEAWFLELLGETDPNWLWSVERDIAPKVYCRLSASGYMDATEWSGPFDDMEAARAAIVEAYDVDPDTGDTIQPEGFGPCPTCDGAGGFGAAGVCGECEGSGTNLDPRDPSRVRDTGTGEAS